jgi:hypothetical protein
MDVTLILILSLGPILLYSAGMSMWMAYLFWWKPHKAARKQSWPPMISN